jgi:hypothetical protein
LSVQVSLTDSPNLFDDGGPLTTVGKFIDHVVILINNGTT